jgi:hypothetical protein
MPAPPSGLSPARRPAPTAPSFVCASTGASPVICSGETGLRVVQTERANLCPSLRSTVMICRPAHFDLGTGIQIEK